MKITIGNKINDLKIEDAQGRDVLAACHDQMIYIESAALDIRAGELPTLQIKANFRGAEISIPAECVGMSIVCQNPAPPSDAALVRIAEIIELVIMKNRISPAMADMLLLAPKGFEPLPPVVGETNRTLKALKSRGLIDTGWTFPACARIWRSTESGNRIAAGLECARGL